MVEPDWVGLDSTDDDALAVDDALTDLGDGVEAALAELAAGALGDAEALDGVTPAGVELQADRITNPATTEPAPIHRFTCTASPMRAVVSTGDFPGEAVPLVEVRDRAERVHVRSRR